MELQFPTTTAATRVAHITDDGKMTRCHHECSDWHKDTFSTTYTKVCPRCGTPEEFAAVAALLAERETQWRAQQQADGRAWNRKRSAKLMALAKLADQVRDLALSAGIEVETGVHPSGKPWLRFFTQAEGEQLYFETIASVD